MKKQKKSINDSFVVSYVKYPVFFRPPPKKIKKKKKETKKDKKINKK